MGERPGVRSGFGEAFRVWPSISWVLVGISWVLLSISRFAEAFRGYWWAFRVLLRLFVGIGGLFVFGRGFSWVWVGISCLANRLALETSCLICQSIRQNVSSGEGSIHPDVLG